MPLLVKLSVNCFNGEQIGKDIEEQDECKSEYWMLTEYDEGVKDYWKKSDGNCIVRPAQDERIDDKTEKTNLIPLHLGGFVLFTSQRIMNSFIHTIDGFKSNDV